jgi:hypothetical protein
MANCPKRTDGTRCESNPAAPPSSGRGVRLQYAQTLTALGDDQRAKAVFDWLIANPANKGPGPTVGANGAGGP